MSDKITDSSVDPIELALANPRGFCAGVNLAVESLSRAIDLYGTPIYVYHEIVHNQAVVSRFKQKGAIFVESMDEVPEHATLLYSAHGVSPQIRQISKAKHIRAIDATCPLVTKVHMEAIRFAREGRHIFLVGHQGHDEVEGIVGEAPDQITIVESVSDVENLPFNSDLKCAYVTQTTLSVDDANRIIAALKKKFTYVIGPPKEDICYATQNRQDAIKSFGPASDLVIVVGSQNSSNSKRLTEIASEIGVAGHLVDGPDDIKADWLLGKKKILLSAGASAPEDVVASCVARLKELGVVVVNEKTLRIESVVFGLPKELRAQPSL